MAKRNPPCGPSPRRHGTYAGSGQHADSQSTSGRGRQWLAPSPPTPGSAPHARTKARRHGLKLAPSPPAPVSVPHTQAKARNPAPSAPVPSNTFHAQAKARRHGLKLAPSPPTPVSALPTQAKARGAESEPDCPTDKKTLEAPFLALPDGCRARYSLRRRWRTPAASESMWRAWLRLLSLSSAPPTSLESSRTRPSSSSRCTDVCVRSPSVRFSTTK